MSIAIKIENLSKAYQLGNIGTGTISRDLERWWANARGKEDPFLKIGEVNDRTTKSDSNIVWSLKDINLEIQQGDAVGIIGRNGAGKSTLLKLLSRITAPTTGTIKAKGRIASLLEVGTGFHPELTGRENIYLNGAILGMRKKEIDRKLDQIIDFSGVERYIDTPVKRYSSGMYVRLAFAVAAHLDSEILIVDEVLAVGDAEFQKKCLGKMGEVSKGEGRTVLFVSHNMQSIFSICKNGLILDRGRMVVNDKIEKVVSHYLNFENSGNITSYIGNGHIQKAEINSSRNSFHYNCAVNIKVNFITDDSITNLVLGIVIKNIYDDYYLGFNNKHYLEEKLHDGIVKNGIINVDIPLLPLLPGKYKVDLFLGNSIIDIQVVNDAFLFTIEETKINPTSTVLDYRLNKLFINDIKWSLTNL